MLLTALAGLSLAATGQFRVAQPERKTPRALAVLESYSSGRQRLIPLTFYFEKKYYDAGLYKATPVPFTLYSETVYEVQQFGKPTGTFTVQSATQKDLAWWGNGKLKGLPPPSSLKKPEAKVVVADPGKPVLHRREGSEGDAPPKKQSAAPPPPQEEDPNRPKLHRKDEAGAESKPATQSADDDRPKLKKHDDAEADAKPAAAPADDDRPKLQRKGEDAKAAPAAPKIVVAKSDEERDHPILRRGKPVEEQGGRDLPEYTTEEPVRQVAVSDAGPSNDPPLLIYTCPPEERARLERQAREIAWAELQKMGPRRGLPMAPPQARASARPAGKGSAAKAKAAPAPQWTPQDEQFVPYDLDYSNYATVVYSARYTPEQPELPAGAKPKSWVVTLIAREDEDKLVRLYGAVSDPRELDLYPEVRLVDVVDPEGYGHYVFLLREKKREGVSWLLGRPAGYEVTPVFETAVR